MINDWLTDIREFGHTLSVLFAAPGEYMLSQLSLYLPALATSPGISEADSSLVFTAVLSATFWLLTGIALWRILRLIKDLLRTVNAIALTILFHLSQTARRIKTRAVCEFRLLFPWCQLSGAELDSQVTLDDIDMAVLRSAATCGPGFTTSAVELAGVLKMRPAQVQRSLDKLHKNQLLNTVIGSTEGFDNYRLTQNGAVFMQAWRRKYQAAS